MIQPSAAFDNILGPEGSHPFPDIPRQSYSLGSVSRIITDFPLPPLIEEVGRYNKSFPADAVLPENLDHEALEEGRELSPILGPGNLNRRDPVLPAMHVAHLAGFRGCHTVTRDATIIAWRGGHGPRGGSTHRAGDFGLCLVEDVDQVVQLSSE